MQAVWEINVENISLIYIHPEIIIVHLVLGIDIVLTPASVTQEAWELISFSLLERQVQNLLSSRNANGLLISAYLLFAWRVPETWSVSAVTVRPLWLWPWGMGGSTQRGDLHKGLNWGGEQTSGEKKGRLCFDQDKLACNHTMAGYFCIGLLMKWAQGHL